MQPKVLVALNFRAPAPWAVVYAVKLAARLKFPLVFLGVEPGAGGGRRGTAAATPEEMAAAHQPRLAEVVRLCQEEGVVLEILLAAGPFFQEICRLADSPGNFRFLVMGVPKDAAAREAQEFSAALKHLHQCFQGEILLVREQGKVADLADWVQPN